VTPDRFDLQILSSIWHQTIRQQNKVSPHRKTHGCQKRTRTNAQADCNGCHSAGAQTEYAIGGNPYFGQKPTITNPKTYLGGGNDFGPFPGPGPFPNIISRNLTPDKTGRPEGGNSFAQFKAILRTGIDTDKIHPTCTGAPDGKCIPPPFDGSLLQIVPWPVHQNMTDHDLRAIYEYLSAIPCLEGGPGEPANRCQ
jgi:hypothetical protein